MNIVNWMPLHKNILVVLIERLDGWAAYIGPVPGVCHREELSIVRDVGEKLPERVARVIFPSQTGDYCK